jgi:hypothetical protein
MMINFLEIGKRPNIKRLIFIYYSINIECVNDEKWNYFTDWTRVSVTYDADYYLESTTKLLNLFKEAIPIFKVYLRTETINDILR